MTLRSLTIIPLVLLLRWNLLQLFCLIYVNRRLYASFLLSVFRDASENWVISFLHDSSLLFLWWIRESDTLSLGPDTFWAFKLLILFCLSFLFPLLELPFKKCFSLAINIIVHENLLAHFIQFVIKVCFCLLPHGMLYCSFQFFRKIFVILSLFPIIDASSFQFFVSFFGFFIFNAFFFNWYWTWLITVEFSDVILSEIYSRFRGF